MAEIRVGTAMQTGVGGDVEGWLWFQLDETPMTVDLDGGGKRDFPMGQRRYWRGPRFGVRNLFA